jgi:hypothetical protein
MQKQTSKDNLKFNNLVEKATDDGFDFLRFVYEEKPYPFKHRFFKWICMTMKDTSQETKIAVMELMDQLFGEYTTIYFKDEVWIIHFEEKTELEAIIASVSDDFGIRIQAFSSSNLDGKHPQYFQFLEEAYRKYIFEKPFVFASTTDLIHEVMKSDFAGLRFLRSAVLNRIVEDSQLVQLIYTLFDNHLNVTKTAKQAFMHRNTINNKLEFIYKETGLKIQRFHDAAAMYALLRSK